MELHRLSLLGTVVVVALVVAVVSGCGGGSGDRVESSTNSSANSSATRPVAQTVRISETEYRLTPSSLALPKTGTYELKLVNKGTTTHALEVEGKGVEQKSSEIGPGASTTLDVTFKRAGTYEMYCPIDGHRSQGMEGKITVGSTASGGGGTTMQTDTTPTTTSRYGY
jgi:plastocyanin